MKSKIGLILAGFMVFSLCNMGSVRAEDAVSETPLNKISDWAKTVGKDKAERDRILAERKAERKAKHAAKKAEQMKKKAEKKAEEHGKDAEKAAKDMKKKMGVA